jgi:UPF0755 protein
MKSESRQTKVPYHCLRWLFLCFFFALFYVVLDALVFLSLPPDLRPVERKILVPWGASFRRVVGVLYDNGMVRSAPRFYLLGRIVGVSSKVKAGEYRLNTGMLPLDILDELIAGRVVTYEVTIPEGYTATQIANLLQEKGIIEDRAPFLRLVFDPVFAVGQGIDTSTLEGYLFPDTYRFSKGLSPDAVIGTMLDNFQAAFQEAARHRRADVTLTDREMVILASIIEKETGESQERALISAVFHNRIRKGVPLCSDPTVIYGLENFDGNLSKQDLLTPSPYNTYLHRGLPPGPIANPGKSSLIAAMAPAQSDYLYFVSKNDGSHHFSKTLREHNTAVRRYQKKRSR